jgi:hypothetical protein
MEVSKSPVNVQLGYFEAMEDDDHRPRSRVPNTRGIQRRLLRSDVIARWARDHRDVDIAFVAPARPFRVRMRNAFS